MIMLTHAISSKQTPNLSQSRPSSIRTRNFSRQPIEGLGNLRTLDPMINNTQIMIENIANLKTQPIDNVCKIGEPGGARITL
ncbi:hypothetical protein [Hyphomicrobium sp. LHD-15]|uniref:hypothetical protein n=1 Tax=Hyphomicrobium sp. LHD-15 TaxID=3072142 RepID=UPI00280E912B|nr:hypothetical protein [Hyphomicrobium sp. LHD-15]MDQ8700618.1 hypothetical protein [Hyphomicrobium sp. LHD-15]